MQSYFASRLLEIPHILYWYLHFLLDEDGKSILFLPHFQMILEHLLKVFDAKTAEAANKSNVYVLSSLYSSINRFSAEISDLCNNRILDCHNFNKQGPHISQFFACLSTTNITS